jgi:hypothetical protein
LVEKIQVGVREQNPEDKLFIDVKDENNAIIKVLHCELFNKASIMAWSSGLFIRIKPQ